MKEIKEALNKATQGKWVHANQGWQDGGIESDEGFVIRANGDSYATVSISEEDAHLIINAPEWLASLVSKVEEMQKVLEQTRTGISNAYEFGYLKETDQNDVHNMLERINEALKGATNEQ